jgi:uncharacterized protein
MERLLVWRGIDEWRSEACRVRVEGDRLTAIGTQIGVAPVAYRVDYTLTTGTQWVTSRLDVTATGDGWMRRLDLRSDGAGSWTCTTEESGDVVLPPVGGDLTAVEGALDCDLARCPLTNTMPVLRHRLLFEPGAQDFLMAWVSVPDLHVHPSRQRYEHVGRDETGAVVRYVGEHRGFVGMLAFDADGFVTYYPDLALRVRGSEPS